eukprot:TRINITY_DN5640_c0_g1_i1.p1 TRINITY_DN5640_c0_g1~~TRINITY_DN5640_c0_g1_i1.p1  ORF type:complete len:164 (-),score=13.53 TRINITY_DN5640_c0_g1_i1:66-557(-)
MAIPVHRNFDNGICGCCEDTPQCLLTWTLPCVPFGRTRALVDTDTTEDWLKWCAMFAVLSAVPCMACSAVAWSRGRTRNRFAIEGTSAGDCLLAICCLPCVVQQEARQTGQEGCASNNVRCEGVPPKCAVFTDSNPKNSNAIDSNLYPVALEEVDSPIEPWPR